MHHHLAHAARRLRAAIVALGVGLGVVAGASAMPAPAPAGGAIPSVAASIAARGAIAGVEEQLAAVRSSQLGSYVDVRIARWTPPRPRIIRRPARIVYVTAAGPVVQAAAPRTVPPPTRPSRASGDDGRGGSGDG